MAVVGGGRALPPDVQLSLRRAFKAEVESRLPHLRAPHDLDLARHDAHTLASSAWVVGEIGLSVLARGVERDPSAAALGALVAALEEWVA